MLFGDQLAVRQCTGQFLHLNLVSITELTLKVPGWSLVCHELLSKKLPTFLSRLNKKPWMLQNDNTSL